MNKERLKELWHLAAGVMVIFFSACLGTGIAIYVLGLLMKLYGLIYPFTK